MIRINPTHTQSILLGFVSFLIALTGTVSHATTFNVNVGDYYFDPGDITIATGDMVQWNWVGGDTHNVSTTACQEGFGSADQSGGTFDHTFNTAGDCSYECTIHPEMTGVVHVTGGGGPTPPNPPTNLNATVQGWTTPADYTTINVTWTDSSTNEDGFRIERCTGTGCTGFSTIGTVGAGVQTFPNSGLATTATYRYQVIAYNGAGDSSPNPTDEATTGPDPTAPSVPGTPNVTNGGNGATLNVTWAAASDPESGIDHYVVYRDTVTVTTGGCNEPSGTSCTDDGLTEGTQYCYTVAAVNGNGDQSAQSGQACATTVAAFSPYFSSAISNGSSLAPVQLGDGLLIGGLIIEGSVPQQILLRGRGPSLGDPPFTHTGVLANPTLSLYGGSTKIAQNDDWQTTDSLCLDPAISCGNATDIGNTGKDPCQPNPGEGGPPTNCSLESALLVTLPPGSYTYHLRGVGSGTGLGLVESFNLNGPNTESKFADVSGRGVVPLNSAMAGGFIIEGNSPVKVLIKGRGPFMAAPPYNMSGTLANPVLKLHFEGAVIAQNDDWQTTDPLCGSPIVSCGDAQDIVDTGKDPCQPNPYLNCNLESAILAWLPPGLYGVTLQGAGGATGLGLFDELDVDKPAMINISTRAFVGTGSNNAIAGFIIEGTDPKEVLIRGFGPSLSSFGLTGVLADPILELRVDHDSNPSTPAILVATNDDYQVPVGQCDSPIVSCGTPQDIVNTGMAACTIVPSNPDCDEDAALLVTLPPGVYTATMKGVANGTGTGLIGVDETNPFTPSSLINLSTRAFVGTGSDNEIAGLIIQGNEPKTVLIRGFGPSLSSFGLTGVLADPVLELRVDHDSNPNTPAILVATNDDYQVPVGQCDSPIVSCGTPQDIVNTGMAACTIVPSNPDCDEDAALLVTLPPGVYTATMKGVANGTGTGLIGVDEVGP